MSKLKKLNKKGALDQLGALAIGIATLVVLLAVVFLVLAEVGEQTAILNTNTTLAECIASNRSAACNATDTLIAATATIPGWVPLIVLVAIGGVILALVAKFGGR